MKIAVLSDIHGNLPALNAVLRHARANGAAEKLQTEVGTRIAVILKH